MIRKLLTVSIAAIFIGATAIPASAATSKTLEYSFGTNTSWTSRSVRQEKRGDIFLSHRIKPCSVMSGNKNASVIYTTQLQKWDVVNSTWVIAKQDKTYIQPCGTKAYQFTTWAATGGDYRFKIKIKGPDQQPGVDPITFYGDGQLDYS